MLQHIRCQQWDRQRTCSPLRTPPPSCPPDQLTSSGGGELLQMLCLCVDLPVLAERERRPACVNVQVLVDLELVCVDVWAPTFSRRLTEL